MQVLIIRHQVANGVTYHRLMSPASHIALSHPDIQITAINTIETVPDEPLKDFQLAILSRPDGYQSGIGNIVTDMQRLQKLGIKVILDIDDYWQLAPTHPLYGYYKEQNIPGVYHNAIKQADCVTTTTSLLAGRIQPFNSNVHILPNAINPREPQWESTVTTVPTWSEPSSTEYITPSNPTTSEPPATPKAMDRVRFGWLGGNSHVPDIMLLADGIQRVYSDDSLQGKFQFVYCGFNAKDDNTLKYQDGYMNERVFTNHYKAISKEHSLWLHKFRDEEKFTDEPYRRVWGKDVKEYATLYDLLDVSLIPLVNDRFNACKSELKLIEAGFKHKAVICSDVQPYSPLLTNENSIKVAPHRTHKDFYKAIKRLTLNPNEVSDKADALYETVKDRYSLDTVNQTRLQLWEHLTT